jgi:hypothetical protein
MLHRAMRLASHRNIVIAIKMAHEGGAFFTVVDILLGWKSRRHVGDKAKCRLFSSRQANFGDMVFSVSAHFCVAIFRH